MVYLGKSGEKGALDGEEDLDGLEDLDGEKDKVSKIDELQARQIGSICRQCDMSTWAKKYMAKDEDFVQVGLWDTTT